MEEITVLMVDPTDSVSARNAVKQEGGIGDASVHSVAEQEETIGDASVHSVSEEDRVEQSLQEEDKDETMRRRWKESPFAVGRTPATWADEETGYTSLCSACCSDSRYSYVLCSAVLCRRAGRVGNMVVLAQRMEEIVDVSGQRIRRPRIMCIVGPYWPLPLCLTVPFFVFLSTWTGVSRLPHHPLAVMVTWTICQVGLLVSLANVACRDPGIMYRHAEPPPGQEDVWRWSDQALTYRPANAKFDPECQIVVEDFDHTCPWTGTAIGKNNMPWFRRFLVFTLAVLAYDIVLLTIS